MKKKISMVNITQKNVTVRTAKAYGKIQISKKVYDMIKQNKLPKGDIFSVSQVAGILAAKNVPHIIPLTHPINISHCDITTKLVKYKDKYFCEVTSQVTTESKTGPDIEAIFANVISLVTIYDMVKQFCPEATILEVKLLSKTGGKTEFNVE